MKKYLILIFFSFVGTTFASAKINSTIRDAFSKYEHISVIDRYNKEFLTKFIGDTIIFTFSSQYLDCFSVAQPDTVWLKKKPKKNPELNKHYVLNYAYKGIQEGNKFVTPSSYINGKPFVMYNVESNDRNRGCLISLFDTETLNIITLYMPQSFKYDCSFTTTKTQRLISSLLNKRVYYSPDAPSYSSYITAEFTPCKVLGGDFKILVKKSNGIYYDYKLEANCEIRLTDENGVLISMNPLNREYAHSIPIILTQSEYDCQFRRYSIDSDVNMSILNNEEEFPFSFLTIFGKAKSSYTGIYQFVEPNSSYTSADAYLDNALITIGDALTIGNTEYYKGCLNGKAFFIKTSDVIIPDSYISQLDTLIRQPQDIRDKFFKRQIALSKVLYLDNLQNKINEVKSFSKFGLAIPSWNIYDVSEYTDGTGIRISFFNPTKSVIKYITITLQGYNAVDDPVGRTIIKKCIGPIEPDETASYDFEYAWHSDIVEYAKIRSIVVQYKNGTSKNISRPSEIIFSDDLKTFFYNANPVKNLK